MITLFGRSYLFQKYHWASFQRLVDAVGELFFRPSRTPFPEVRKILISRIDSLDGVFLSCSVLPHLKGAFPKAKIHFITGQWALSFLKLNPYVDKVLVYDPISRTLSSGELKSAASSVRSFFINAKAMANSGYDLCIDLNPGPFNAIPLFAFGKGRYKAGFSTGGYGFLLDKEIPFRPGAHEMTRIADALSALGIDTSMRVLRPEFKVSRSAEQDCNKMLGDLGISDRESFVLIHTGADNPRKLWKKERWQELINKISREYGLKSVVCDPVYGDFRGCIKLSTLVSFELFATVAKRAEVFIGADSAPAHISASFGTPVVAVWCGINDDAQWRPLGDSVSVIKKELPCSPCGRKNGCQGMNCMDISAEDCMKEVRRYLDYLKTAKVVRLRR